MYIFLLLEHIKTVFLNQYNADLLHERFSTL